MTLLVIDINLTYDGKAKKMTKEYIQEAIGMFGEDIS